MSFYDYSGQDRYWMQLQKAQREQEERERIERTQLYATQRVSNADRDKHVSHLTTMFTEGRLNEGEFKQRMDEATAAVYYPDLNKVLRELPPLPQPKVKSETVNYQESSWDGFWEGTLAAGAILLILMGIAFIPYIIFT